jgi:hypothetical protein
MANATEKSSEIESHENENEYVNLRARESELDFPTEQRSFRPMTILPHIHLCCYEDIKVKLRFQAMICVMRERNDYTVLGRRMR